MEGNPADDDSLTIQYLRGRVTSLESDKKKLEERLDDYKHIESQLVSIWNIIFPEDTKKEKANKDELMSLDVDKLHSEYSQISSRIAFLENNVICLKNRESELLLKLNESQKSIHFHQTQILSLKDEIKSQSLRNKKSQFVDPLINYNFNLMLSNINDLNKQLKASRDEAIANGFNLQSQSGRALIEKCKNLIIENQILGRQIKMNKHSNLTQKIILLHQHNLKLSDQIVKSKLFRNNQTNQIINNDNKNNNTSSQNN